MESASTVWDILPSNMSRPSLSGDPFWGQYERHAVDASIHIAILARKYLELILNREKTIEARFSVNRRVPYKRVKNGDVILLKESSGPIRGVGYVSDVWFYELTDGILDHIQRTFGQDMQVQDQAFWAKCMKSCFATLMRLEHVRRIDPIEYSKRNRNAWAVFTPYDQSPLNLRLF